MGKLILVMNVSLDGYVDGIEGKFDMGAPGPELFAYWIRSVQGLDATIYGRRMYEAMRYWDTDQPDWTEPLREFAVAWRALPKWVVSSTLESVGRTPR